MGTKTNRKLATFLVLSSSLLLLLCCRSEKKMSSYDDLYKEKPVTVLVAPVQDNTKPLQAKTTQDKLFNDELHAAACYLQQTVAEPLIAQGYYTPAPLASEVIMGRINKDYKQLMRDDLKELSAQYGIDAVLLVAIHKWQEPEINEIVVYAEYTLRSTKSGTELMHTWVRGRKMQPVDHIGEPVELQSDTEFMEQTGLDSRLAHRCILLREMSGFVLRNLPTSASRWHFKHDQYIPSNPDFYGFVINPDGSLERSEYTEDEFGNECFTD